MSHGGRKGDRPTTALLLAAGTGRRLQPLTNDRPKCMTEINGTSILERLVRCLNQHDFNRLVVVVGHFENSIRKFLDERAGGLTIDYIVSSRYRTRTTSIRCGWPGRKFRSLFS